MCVYLCLCMDMYVQVRGWCWETSWLFSTVVIESGSVSQTQNLLLSLVYPANLFWESLVSATLTLELQMCHPAHLTFTWVLGIQTPILMISWQVLKPLSHFQAPHHVFWAWINVSALYILVHYCHQDSTWFSTWLLQVGTTWLLWKVIQKV